MGRGLLLVGHGSRRNRCSSDAVYEQAERIRRRGLFEEVRAAFLKEAPFASGELAGMCVEEVSVVPMFASAGYYCEQVIPRELRLEGAETLRDGRRILYRAPVGTHPGIAEIIIERAYAEGADDAASLVVLGHGTRHYANSEKSVHEQAARVRARGIFAEVCVAFIDQEPNMMNVWDLTTHRRVVMAPFFMAEGWHVRETIPGDLSLEDGICSWDGRSLRLTECVGTHPRIAELIVESACEDRAGAEHSA